MGTNSGDIATNTPPAIHPPASFSADKFSVDDSRPKSLKRAREPTPSSPVRRNSNHFGSGSASPAKSARLAGQTSRRSHSPPLPSPGLEEDGRWSEDDPTSREVIEKELASSVMASASVAPPQPQLEASASVAASAPTPKPQSQEAQQAPTAVMAPPSDHPKTETSPRSTTSGPGQVTTTPEAMDVDSQGGRPPTYGAAQTHPEDRPASSMSYPPILTTASTSLPATPNIPQRTSSHPMPGSQDATPRSPSSSNKKHKCPFCETEFTRHHNLKSHLLTHSQEKPYECSTCQMRFRRLHDLKRHSKLHTGEKPHICPKCDRKFARGDALARHSKGAGGCAGRRHSLPFDGDTSNFEGQSNADGDESAMTGVRYEGGSNEVEMSEEDCQRTMSVANAYATAAAAHSRTYPPAGARSSGLYPPNADRAASNNTSSAPNSLGSSHAAIASASLYAQNAMTESPKPLSPHSNATQAYQTQNQQHINRRPSDGLSLPSAHNNGTVQPSKAPGIAGFAPPDGRYGPAAGSHSRNSSAPNAEIGNMMSADQVWPYISSLESTIKQLAHKVDTMEKEKNAQILQLSSEVSALRQQIADPLQEPSLPAGSEAPTKE
ncbi:uncharacterized protein MKZ38_002914 [Zalerion maritima]|uniref:C2H2-type domain-containing protein n=1 Tax=Zalerion maritima TaxID=339359 RepID=A0AAD5RP27_9PEZI|nr:uncharacterized protein MKZ38_002914 [Zalerion maritima]